MTFVTFDELMGRLGRSGGPETVAVAAAVEAKVVKAVPRAMVKNRDMEKKDDE